MDDLVEPFEGTAFRFVDPRFSSTSDLFSGKGANFANGRWLLKSEKLATYCALDPETALVESLATSDSLILGRHPWF
jgi:RES domain-containing protein